MLLQGTSRIALIYLIFAAAINYYTTINKKSRQGISNEQPESHTGWEHVSRVVKLFYTAKSASQ